MEGDGSNVQVLERCDSADPRAPSRAAELLRSRSFTVSAAAFAARSASRAEARTFAAFPIWPPALRATRRASPWPRLSRAALRSLVAAARLGLSGFFLYLCVFNFSIVRGSSMSPGIHDGDRILIDQVSYWFTGVDRGDVVVLRYPPDPSVEYIKRVVGLPGDEVVMAGGLVWVNGRLLEEPYVGELDPSAWSRERVRDACVYVLGDNRPHSSDSREFGQVPIENLRGKVDLRVWPPERIGWIQ